MQSIEMLIVLAWGARGPEFKSRRPDQLLQRLTLDGPAFSTAPGATRGAISASQTLRGSRPQQLTLPFPSVRRRESEFGPLRTFTSGALDNPLDSTTTENVHASW
jgi:hypothetical protein